MEEEAAKLGLHLNHSKSELICDDAPTREAMLFEVPSYGGPVGSLPFSYLSVDSQL